MPGTTRPTSSSLPSGASAGHPKIIKKYREKQSRKNAPRMPKWMPRGSQNEAKMDTKPQKMQSRGALEQHAVKNAPISNLYSIYYVLSTSGASPNHHFSSLLGSKMGPGALRKGSKKHGNTIGFFAQHVRKRMPKGIQNEVKIYEKTLFLQTRSLQAPT